MTRLFLLPIEPLAERYTGAWYRWLPESFGKAFDVRVIHGVPLTSHVKVGAFLDLNSTAHYKATQLQRVARMFHDGEVQNGDAFFIADLEFWGIEMIAYLARLQGLRVRVYGFLHAASYTHEDFMAPMKDIGEYVEPAWIAACDRVFVGSTYHLQAVYSRRLSPVGANELFDRIVVTGNPWRTDEAIAVAGMSPEYRTTRDIDILFPHRPDHEKRPGAFVDMVRAYVASGHKMPTVAFTTGRPEYRSTNDPAALQAIRDLAIAYPDHVRIYTNCDRAKFYALLARSRVIVSAAIEENFGYAMVEGMAQGALPLMPNSFSYPELVQFDSRFLYNAPLEFFSKLTTLLSPHAESLRSTAVDYARAFDVAEGRIVAAMQELS